MSTTTERRQKPRAQLDTAVGFRRRRETRHTLRMQDLSEHGCRLATQERLDGREIVWVTLPGLESLQATVRWSRSWLAGVEFERPMHQAVFAMMAGRLQGKG